MKKGYFYAISAVTAIPCMLFAAHIGFMMPAGGRQGTTVEVIIGGQAFWNVDKAFISGEGVSVEKVQFVRGIPHPDGKQRRWINQTLRNYHNGKMEAAPKPESTEGWRNHPFYDRLLELTPCEREILYRFLFVPYNSLQASPAIAGRAIVTLKIAADAPVGEREFRLIARNGSLSNPLKFFVGSAPEFREGFFPYPAQKKADVTFTIPAALNGQITPGETDIYKFTAEKGKKITFQFFGRYFNPFIGDGVPGHFQAVLEVADKDGRVVAYADDHHFDPDPVLTFTVPVTGEYTLRIRDALYRGREDFVYRINAFYGELPVKLPAPPLIKGVKLVDGSKIRDGKTGFPVMISDCLLTKEGNTYQVELKKNEKIIAEIFSRRLGSPPDARLIITDESGRIIAHNDDTPRLKAGLILHNTADPQVIFTAPADGVYRINVADTAGASGKDHHYFLRIDHPRPRFAVYSIPSSLSLAGGSANRMRLAVERFDGFEGEIKLRVRKPAGFQITGTGIIPAGAENCDITVTSAYDNKKEVKFLELEAYCGDFSTTVIPGDEATQAFAYTHINPAKCFPFRVLRKGQTLTWDLKSHTLELTANKPVTLKVKKGNSYFPPGVEISLVPVTELPKWLTLVNDVKSKGKTVLVKLPKKRQRI
ncbi:MAG: PPC domain-containing protein, partial [Lentisphaeria bacterium]|nr:PPC domain-containing protein [Lentisphaeria bacterium]